MKESPQASVLEEPPLLLLLLPPPDSFVPLNVPVLPEELFIVPEMLVPDGVPDHVLPSSSTHVTSSPLTDDVPDVAPTPGPASC